MATEVTLNHKLCRAKEKHQTMVQITTGTQFVAQPRREHEKENNHEQVKVNIQCDQPHASRTMTSRFDPAQGIAFGHHIAPKLLKTRSWRWVTDYRYGFILSSY